MIQMTKDRLAEAQFFRGRLFQVCFVGHSGLGGLASFLCVLKRTAHFASKGCCLESAVATTYDSACDQFHSVTTTLYPQQTIRNQHASRLPNLQWPRLWPTPAYARSDNLRRRGRAGAADRSSKTARKSTTCLTGCENPRHRSGNSSCAWPLTKRSLVGGRLPQMSNSCCHPGRARGTSFDGLVWWCARY
jgi:hypothetical protein